MKTKPEPPPELAPHNDGVAPQEQLMELPAEPPPDLPPVDQQPQSQKVPEPFLRRS